MTRGLPRVGEILFTTEAPMGNAAVIDLMERFALAQRTICFRLFGGLDPRFVTLQIRSPLFQAILDFAATGLTAKAIKAGKLKRIPFVLPPLAEQRRIVLAHTREPVGWVEQSETHRSQWVNGSQPAGQRRVSAESGSGVFGSIPCKMKRICGTTSTPSISTR